MPLELIGLIASEIRVTLLGMGSFPLERPMLASSQVPDGDTLAQIQARDLGSMLGSLSIIIPSQQTTILFILSLQALVY